LVLVPCVKLNLFVSLVLMTYISVVLLLSGYQADEQRMLKGYEEIISKYGFAHVSNGNPAS